jgi:hypothetical protein
MGGDVHGLKPVLRVFNSLLGWYCLKLLKDVIGTEGRLGEMIKKMTRIIVISLGIILLSSLLTTRASNAYYGGGMYGMMGGLYGMYGMMGGLYGMYGGMMGGMMGGLYGMYGGMMGGMYGGMMGMYGPFSIANMYYPVETGSGLTYQLPFMMALPYIGMSGLYKQLFPSLFDSQ